MKSNAQTVKDYLASLPEDRRQAMDEVRKVILKNLRKGFEEGMQYGMISFHVPFRLYPEGYHANPKQPLPFACLASQKNHMSLYLMCVYDDQPAAKEFREEWAKTGLKLDMGKSCIRFKSLDDLPLKLIGKVVRGITVEYWIEQYENCIKSLVSPASTETVKPRKKRPAKARK